MRANWFIGLASAQSPELPIGPPPPRVRVFHPADLHLTLAFLGGCGQERARAAWSLLAGAELPAVETTLAPVVPMGPPARWSALSAEVDVGRDALVALMDTWQDRLRAAAGARPARHAPRPHLTVARPQRRATPAERAAALAWGQALPLAGLPLSIDRLRLYTWSEDRRERLFAVVEERELSAGGPSRWTPERPGGL